MSDALCCARCGGPLPVAAVHVAMPCAFCGTVNAPKPRVVEKVVTVEHVVERVVVRDSAGNPATLPCLRCGQPLVDAHIGDTTVSQCRACGGLWLPVEAVERLRRVSDDELRNFVARGEILALARPPRGELACPVCQTPLERLALSETVHDVDVCRKHGTWFDRTELAAFIDREKMRREGSDSPRDSSAVGDGFLGNLLSLFTQ